jgi:hypothetical protein
LALSKLMVRVSRSIFDLLSRHSPFATRMPLSVIRFVVDSLLVFRWLFSL